VGSLCMDLPPFLSELHGSFIDLVQQLQDCVHQRRQREERNDGMCKQLCAANGYV
jgi:hypothetical protein